MVLIPLFDRDYRAKQLAKSSGVTRGESMAVDGGVRASAVTFMVFLSRFIQGLSAKIAKNR